MKPSKTASLFFPALLFILFAAPLWAAETKPLVVSPSKIEVKANPGQKIKDFFIISNNGQTPVRMKVSVKDYRQGDEKGKVEFYRNEEMPLEKILIPEFTEIGVNPGEKKQVNFIADVPAGIKSGGYYGAILLESLNDKTAGPKNPFGVLVLLTVVGGEGQAAATIEITKFSADKFSFGPASFNLEMNNSGNTHVMTRAAVLVKNWRNKEVANLNAGNQLIYPGSPRVFKWNWKNAPKIGFYRAELEISPLGNDSQKFRAKTWFIIFPWKMAGYSAAGLLAVFIVYFSARKGVWRFWPFVRSRKKSWLAGQAE